MGYSGLQRLSTYLHFKGELELPDHDPSIKRGESFLELESCDIVPELNGMKFSDLTTSLQHRVRRATLRVDVVRREGNPRFAYHMFKRLNTGGEPLSNQETRNCSIRLLGDSFVAFSGRMVKDENFQICIEDITDEYRSRMGEDELVLRFFAFKNDLKDYVHDIDPFLTRFLERVTDQMASDAIPFNFVNEEAIFRKTFKVIAKTLGAKAFSRYSNNRPAGGFAMGHFEAFSLGLAKVVENISDDPEPQELEQIKQALLNAKNDPNLRDLTVGGGKNFRRIYERKIELVANQLRAIYE
jgi:hypothetical protein